MASARAASANATSRHSELAHEYWFAARSSVALALTLVRYWLTVAPLVRGELDRWEQHAQRITDPTLRKLALKKLHDEHFNAEIATLLATRAPRADRACVVKAIVALEILYEYLDALSESSPTDVTLSDGHQLFSALTDAISDDEPGGDYYRHHPYSADNGYLTALVTVVRSALAGLPLSKIIRGVVQNSAGRASNAQVRIHAEIISTAQLERWATLQAADTALQWREWLAGSIASVLAIHALIVAAADHRITCEEAVKIDSAYLSLCALCTMLDSLIDYEHDTMTGKPRFIALYNDQDILARQLRSLLQTASAQTRTLTHSEHHAMILAGVVAYYTSAPAADQPFARPVVLQVQRELRPLITPALAVLHAWRAGKLMRQRWRNMRR